MKLLPPFLAFLLAVGLVWSQQPQPQPAPMPLSVKDALTKFTTPDDLAIDPVLSEPQISQPVHLGFDERGRLWVMEYRQYPFPAGLKQLGHDRFWRVVYDRVPPPPPNHFVGKDRITIHEDTQGNGTFDKHTTFIDGLNIATSCARGRGGVYVLNPPYLLFYPSKNGDTPDGPPEVLLEGFGIEDTHSCANSLTWGPDGWLYAAQGSTVSGAVKRYGSKDQPVHSMGQLIWRFHPERKVYEIFAEGGGNAFGVEFDVKGRLFSGYNGGDTRGFHYVQGGYYRKGFDKHGPLSNPYTFGYFAPMKSPPLKRFSHTFVVNEGKALGAKYDGMIFAVDPLASKVMLSERTVDGSTFQTKDTGAAISSADTWFRPVDIKVGPGGSLYVADFYDQHIAHLRHHEGMIDKDNGRIYRLRAMDAQPWKPVDLGKLTSAELVTKLSDADRWTSRTALRLLGDRKDVSVVPTLRKMLAEDNGQTALEALWALYQCGAFGGPETRFVAMNHKDPYVRAWGVRLLCELESVDIATTAGLETLARREENVEVRSQLLCSAKRLPGALGLIIVRTMLERDADITDPHLPLLAWWAVEAKAISERETVLRLFAEPSLWQRKMGAFVVERLMRRYAAGGTQADLRACARLLKMAPGDAQAKLLLASFEAGTAGRTLGNLPTELVDALAARGGGSLTLRLRQRQPAAIEEALRTLREGKAPAKDRAGLARLLGELQEKTAVPVLLGLLDAKEPDLVTATLSALQGFGDEAIAAKILERYKSFPPSVREVAENVLVARPAWGLALLQAIDAGKLTAKDVSEDAPRRLTLHKDARIPPLVKKIFGSVLGETTEAMKATIERLGKVVRAERGDPAAGKKLFGQSCGKCHQLFGEGGQVGPDLTTFKRDDIDHMLLHIVNPSAEIREGYETHVVVTEDGRVVQGFLVDRDEQVVILRGADGQTYTIAKNKIDEMRAIRLSLMPENLLRDLTDQQVRDLFAYLRSGQPLQVPGG
jgi:putative heme-binding domain-containing protein